jgi:hypothetical protein
MESQGEWLHGLLHRHGFDKLQSQMRPVRWTANMSQLQLHALHKVMLMDQGKDLYGRLTARRWHLRVHCLQRRQFHRMAQMSVNGHTTVKGRWLSARPRAILPVPTPSVRVCRGAGQRQCGLGLTF